MCTWSPTFIAGTPQHCLPLDRIVERACAEAELYQQCGVDGILVENMHDLPYMRGKVGPEIVASMTRVCSEIKHAVKDIPMGIQILAGGLIGKRAYNIQTIRLCTCVVKTRFAQVPTWKPLQWPTRAAPTLSEPKGLYFLTWQTRAGWILALVNS